MLTLKKDKAEVINKVVMLNVEDIYPNPRQPRKSFSAEALQELSKSIAENGLLQPITVRKREIGYELISGERRLRACKLNQVEKVPAIVVELSDHGSGMMALVENIQREDLHFLEEAAAIQKLLVDFDLTQTEVAQKLGKSQSGIANKLRLLQLPEAVRVKALEFDLNERQTRALLRLKEEALMLKTIDVIDKRKLNSEETDAYIESMLHPSKKQKIKFCIKDIRIFDRTLDKALKLINQSGIKAVSECKETEDGLDYHIHIPKNKSK